MLIAKWGKCWPSSNPPPRHASSSPGEIAAAVQLADTTHRFYSPCLTMMLDVTAADPSGTYIRSSELHIHAGM